jgi:hypothetical protein
METQQFRITRTNPGYNFSIPCSGGTDFWPINTSWDCSGVTMYQATGTQVMNAIETGMDSFPEELRDCSLVNPCIVLWDLIPTSHQLECNNIGGYKYVKFSGLRLTSGGTIYNKSYNEIIPAIYDINNLTTSLSLNKQNSGLWLLPLITACGCNNEYLNADLYKLTTLLTQDINDIGHYTVWDGNMEQKEVFANFVYSGASNGWGVQLYNTTDFGYYPSLQDSEYVINWGDGTIETLQYPTLKSIHIYCPVPVCPPKQYTITITHKTPWGPVSSSKVVTIPHKDYIGLLTQPYVPSITWTGGTGLGSQQFNYTYTPPGTTAQTTSVAYHTMYPSTPLDSATNINQYSGMGFDTVLNTAPCFTVSGVTTSMLGSFKQYTGTTNSLFLPGGYMTGIEVSIAGDVLSPITNSFVPGIQGKILTASAQYTAYTLYSSVNQRTPIEFYDFPDGITIFISESCGLDAIAFGGGACYECATDTCEWCLTKDEYIDRTVGNINSGAALATPTPKTTQGLWNDYQNYVAGDIVFDKTFNDCCCYIALVDIAQTGILSDFAGIAPALSSLVAPGVLVNASGTQVHVWEACSPDCASCPTGSMTPCDDPSISSTSYDDSTVYTANEYVSTLNGCYQATALVGSTSPTADTMNVEWDYIGCVHWSCPTSPTTPGGCVRTPGVGGPQTYMMWQQCENDLAMGNCYPPRWLCTSQFDCGACQSIDSTHPDWGLISATGPAFSTPSACLTYCKPPIYVCDDRNNGPCCEEVTCGDVAGGFSMSNIGTWPAEKGPGPYDYNTITTTGTLNLDFHLTLAGCQGVSNAGCCNLSNYDWSCESGCYPVSGPAQFSDLIACQGANHGNFVDALGGVHPYSYTSNVQPTVDIGGAPDMYNICGWQCSVWNSPCTPIFTDSGFAYQGNAFNLCSQNCTAATECHVCDCDLQQHCQLEQPCPTPGSHWNGMMWVPGVNSPGDGLMGPDPVNLNGFGLSFSSHTDCSDTCVCDAGYDCWIDIAISSQMGTPTSVGGCQYIANSFMLTADNSSTTSGLTSSQFGPYDTFSACCAGTDCCIVRCNDDWPTWGDAAPIPYGDWPCQYITPTASGSYDAQGNFVPPGTCGSVYDPVIPFCNMVQCLAAIVSTPPGAGNTFCTQGISYDGQIDLNGVLIPGTGSATDWCKGCPGTGVTSNDSCECACSGVITSPPATHTDMGAWISSNPFYTIGDTVSYMDGTNPLCCYICGCFSADTNHPLVYEGNPGIARQCGMHSPGDGAVFNALDSTPIANCWTTCDKMPSGTTEVVATGCTTCGSGPTLPSYSCGGIFNGDNIGPDLAGGWTNGCIMDSSAGHCIPPMDSNVLVQIAQQTLANCFSDSDCNLKCQGGCFCEAGGSPYTAGTSSCVTNQQYDINVANDPNAYGDFGGSIINFPFQNLDQCNVIMATGNYDCCGNPRYNCLSGHTCTSDPTLLAQQVGEMNSSLDACVALYPQDVGYGDAQFRDEIATASTFTLCGGATSTFIATASRTAAYNMCSYYCRWSCSNQLTPANYCHFVGDQPAELALVAHPIYNLTAAPIGCAAAPMYTSAVDCWQSSTNPFDCFCNTDWVDCVTTTTTEFTTLGAFSPVAGVTNSSTCTCTLGATGMYHTMDECQNPSSYPNVATSCCDGSNIAWCLAVGTDLVVAGGCDGGFPQLDDADLSLVNTHQQYVTDWVTNSSGLPGDVLYEQYYKGGAFHNGNLGKGLSPNLMYSLQTQINKTINDGNDFNDDHPFESVGVIAVTGSECVAPNIPSSFMEGLAGSDNDPLELYPWGLGGNGATSDVYTTCCFSPVDQTGNFIRNRVRSISHEYLTHADQYLTSVVGTLPQDNHPTTPYGYDYSNLDRLIEAADYIGVTGLTSPTTKVGWNFNGNGFHATEDYYCTDIHEISYQITQQYYERIYPGEMGQNPPYCIQGEQYLPPSPPTIQVTADTYMSCVEIKVKGCCLQPCFCTEDGNAFTWSNGVAYTSSSDPMLSTGTDQDTTQAPFVMDFLSPTTGYAAAYFDTFMSPISVLTTAYGNGYYSNHTCKSDLSSCCGQNTQGLIPGCTDQTAFNFDCKSTTYANGVPCGDGVNVDDGSCDYIYGTGVGECIWGCYDSSVGVNPDTDGIGSYAALNYNPNATCFSACTY